MPRAEQTRVSNIPTELLLRGDHQLGGLPRRAEMVCGVCGRLLDRLGWFLDTSWVVSLWPQRVDADGTIHDAGKPSISRSAASMYAITADLPMMGTLRYECHRRCGRPGRRTVYVVRAERLQAAMLAGKARIVAGVDV